MPTQFSISTPQPRLGSALATAAAVMWAFNAVISKILLTDAGLSATRLAQLRSIIAGTVLLVVIAWARPVLLRVHSRDLLRLALLGVVLALVNGAYFVAIQRLAIGVALTIQYLGPLLILLWLRIVHRRPLPRTLWVAAALAFAGCGLVVRVWDGGAMDLLGVIAAASAAISFASYIYRSEQIGARYGPVTTLLYSFAFASLFWAIVQPLWSFPIATVADARYATIAIAIGVLGTLLPFGCLVLAVRYIPGHRAALVATLEPVLAAGLAWILRHESLGADQIGGGLVVVGAVLWVQRFRADAEVEGTVALRPPR